MLCQLGSGRVTTAGCELCSLLSPPPEKVAVVLHRAQPLLWVWWDDILQPGLCLTRCSCTDPFWFKIKTIFESRGCYRKTN